MKTIVAGSRGITEYEHVAIAIAASGFTITEVVSGTARGVDRLGERWGDEHDVPIARFVAQWRRYGRRAGFLRNEQMAEHADALIAVWDGESRGTLHMIRFARRRGLNVYVYTPAVSQA